MSFRHLEVFTIELKRKKHLDNSDSKQSYLVTKQRVIVCTVPPQTRPSGTSNKTSRWQVQSKQLEAVLRGAQGCTGDPGMLWRLNIYLDIDMKRKKEKKNPPGNMHARMPSLAEGG